MRTMGFDERRMAIVDYILEQVKEEKRRREDLPRRGF